MPSVTVVIPIYNGRQFIRETLESVFAQTYTDHEVICVDDGSTDDSLATLNEYRGRVLVIQQANTGRGGGTKRWRQTGNRGICSFY